MRSENDLSETLGGGWLGRLAQEALARVREAIFCVGCDGQILYANRAASQCLGYSRQGLLRMRLHDICVNGSHGAWEQQQREVDHDGALTVKSSLRAKDGRVMPVEATIGSYEIEGEPYGLVVAYDLTEHMQAEEALQVSEERFHALMEHANDTVTVLDADGTITFKSPPVVPHAGFSAQELLGEDAFKYVHPNDLPRVLETWEAVRSEPDAVRTVEFRVRYKDGSWGVLESTMKNLLDDPRVKGVVVNSRNVTERRRAHEAEVRARETAEALRAAGMALTSSLEFDQVSNLILEQINRVLAFDFAAVQLPDGRDLVTVSARDSDLAAEYPFFNQSLPGGFRSHLAVPLTYHDRFLGVLSLYRREAGRFSPEDERLAASFASQVAVALENSRLFEEMKRLATTDALTGVYSRGHFLFLAANEMERATRYGRPLSAFMLDIDGFKRINDWLGHAAGDRVLVEVAGLCRSMMRKTDVLGRYGGDEFAAILPDTLASQAFSVTERLRLLIESSDIPLPQGTVRVTVSLGVASIGGHVTSLESLLGEADGALYRAKQGGRDRVCVSAGNDI